MFSAVQTSTVLNLTPSLKHDIDYIIYVINSQLLSFVLKNFSIGEFTFEICANKCKITSINGNVFELRKTPASTSQTPGVSSNFTVEETCLLSRALNDFFVGYYGNEQQVRSDSNQDSTTKLPSHKFAPTKSGPNLSNAKLSDCGDGNYGLNVRNGNNENNLGLNLTLTFNQCYFPISRDTSKEIPLELLKSKSKNSLDELKNAFCGFNELKKSLNEFKNIPNETEGLFDGSYECNNQNKTQSQPQLQPQSNPQSHSQTFPHKYVEKLKETISNTSKLQDTILSNIGKLPYEYMEKLQDTIYQILENFNLMK